MRKLRIEPSIMPGDSIVYDHSDPAVAKIVFDGTHGECIRFIKDQDEFYTDPYWIDQHGKV